MNIKENKEIQEIMVNKWHTVLINANDKQTTRVLQGSLYWRFSEYCYTCKQNNWQSWQQPCKSGKATTSNKYIYIYIINVCIQSI